MKTVLIITTVVSFAFVFGSLFSMLITYIKDGKKNYVFWKNFWFGKY